MNWKNIKVNGRSTDGTYMLDIVDVYECRKENKPANCTGCPYIRTCNKYEQGNDKLMNDIIPEFNTDRN